MSQWIRYAGLSDTGRQRERNEDAWVAVPESGLFIVSDGMGGQFEGALAAKVVVKTLPGLLVQGLGGIPDLSVPEARAAALRAIRDLSDRLREETTAEPGFEGMGATVVLAVVRETQLLVSHMGDSRAYLFRSGELRQLTKDHSIVQLLLDRGEITPEEAVSHPARGQLTRYVGMATEALPEADLVELGSGDRLLLCTDGLTGMLSDQQILAILSRDLTPEQICRELVSAANREGGKDNITVVIVSWPTKNTSQ